MIDATTLTYGIELETLISDEVLRNDGVRIGPYKHGIQVPYLPTGWTAERDGSINAPPGWQSCEIVSPILRGPEGIAQIAEVTRILDAKKHRITSDCSCHLHVGWDPNWPSDALARLITIIAYVEKGLYAITGTKSRERGRFCRSVRTYSDQKTAKTRIDADRYHLLNLTNLARGTKPTIEIRAFSGTTNAKKSCGWAMCCLGLVQRALNSKRCPTWTPKPLTGGWKKKGEGQSEAERLMGYLAWGECYARIHGGVQYGWISDVIPQEEIKAEFRRLAAKYDAQP